MIGGASWGLVPVWAGQKHTEIHSKCAHRDSERSLRLEGGGESMPHNSGQVLRMAVVDGEWQQEAKAFDSACETGSILHRWNLGRLGG